MLSFLDPGLGFAKNADHNWTARYLDSLRQLGRPLAGRRVSKAIPGSAARRCCNGEQRPMEQRDAATAAVTALAAAEASGAFACTRCQRA